MRGNNIIDPNDGSAITLALEVEDEGDDSEDVEDMEDALNVELILRRTLPQLKLVLPLFYCRRFTPSPIVNNEPSEEAETL